MIYRLFRKEIARNIDEGIKNFIIYPFGKNGMLVKDILNQCFGISELMIIDNQLSKYNSKIKDIDYLKEYEFDNTTKLLITSLKIQVPDFIDSDAVIDVFQSQREQNKNILGGKYSYGPLTQLSYRIESMGNFCCFAVGTDIVWNHPLNMVTQHDFIYESTVCHEITNQQFTMSDFNKKCIIGNDVWLGKNVILTNGVKIGNGVRAAAGSVITKDVPDYAVVAGVPARIIKYRFSDDQILKLNKIKWWDWPIEKIRDCYEDFIDIDVFLKKHFKDSL